MKPTTLGLRPYRLGMLILFSVYLTGCAGMNGSFNCKRIDGKGMGCTSVQDVNQLANRGAFNEMTTPSSHTTHAPISMTTTPFRTPNAGDPLRECDVTQRIWIAPYQDKQGRYYEPSYVVVVVKPSHWLGLSPVSIQSSNQES